MQQTIRHPTASCFDVMPRTAYLEGDNGLVKTVVHVSRAVLSMHAVLPQLGHLTRAPVVTKQNGCHTCHHDELLLAQHAEECKSCQAEGTSVSAKLSPSTRENICTG